MTQMRRPIFKPQCSATAPRCDHNTLTKTSYLASFCQCIVINYRGSIIQFCIRAELDNWSYNFVVLM